MLQHTQALAREFGVTLSDTPMTGGGSDGNFTAALGIATLDGLGIDGDGRTTFVNPAAERLLGWTAAELVGHDQHAAIHHTRADGTPYPEAECPLRAARLEGRACRVDDELFWRRDGSAFPVEYTVTPVFERGRPAGASARISSSTRTTSTGGQSRASSHCHSFRQQVLGGLSVVAGTMESLGRFLPGADKG